MQIIDFQKQMQGMSVAWIPPTISSKINITNFLKPGLVFDF